MQRIVTILYIFFIFPLQHLYSSDTIAVSNLFKEAQILLQNPEKNLNDKDKAERKIEEIKVIYKKSSLDYNKPYGNGPQLPLLFALMYSPSFALFLIEKMNVDTTTIEQTKSTFSLLMYSIVINGLQQEHEPILKLLIDKNCNINAIDANGFTPIAQYMECTQKQYNLNVLKLFFNYGAQLFVNGRVYDAPYTCNTIAIFLNKKSSNVSVHKEAFFKKITVNEENHILPLVAMILMERLNSFKRNYFKQLCLANWITKSCIKTKKISPFTHSLATFLTQDDASLIDIKNCLLNASMNSIYNITDKKINLPQKDSDTGLLNISKLKHWGYSSLLSEIVSDTFWRDQPPYAIIAKLNCILEKGTIVKQHHEKDMVEYD